MLLMCGESYFTRTWCVLELAAGLRQDGNRLIDMLCSGYGAVAVLGRVVHCINAVCLTIQFNAVAGKVTTGSLPARLHLALRSVQGEAGRHYHRRGWHGRGPSPHCLRICLGCGNARR